MIFGDVTDFMEDDDLHKMAYEQFIEIDDDSFVCPRCDSWTNRRFCDECGFYEVTCVQ